MGQMKPRGTSDTGSSSTSSGTTRGGGQLPTVGTWRLGSRSACRVQVGEGFDVEICIFWAFRIPSLCQNHGGPTTVATIDACMKRD